MSSRGESHGLFLALDKKPSLWQYVDMSDMVLIGLIAGLVLTGFMVSKGKQWCSFKLRYYKRILWNAFGVCPRCGHRMSYTSTGRGICTNGNCKKV